MILIANEMMDAIHLFDFFFLVFITDCPLVQQGATFK
jgi:hypothetical protein